MTASQQASGEKFHRYPLWSPRFWHGLRTRDWIRLLARNRFRIHPTRMPMAFAVSCITPFNSCMSLLQQLAYGRRVAATELREPPVFILGHWRSGTTFLHELMVRDDRFTYPTTFACFAPHHFLLTEWFFVRFGRFLLPKQRPMDNMAAGWERPQEDEFALLTLGLPTPYRRMAFPNHPPVDQEFLDMQEVEGRALEEWKEGLQQFLKAVTFRDRRRLLLKSPPHTGRLSTLAGLFPEAKFVHITRHPWDVFASSRRLWRALDEVQGFQRPRHAGLDAFIFDSFDRMYGGFEAQRAELAADRLCDVRYEDLVANPCEELERVYRELDLFDYEPVRPRIEEFVQSSRDYRTNRHPDLEPDVREQIAGRWESFARRYGYELEV